MDPEIEFGEVRSAAARVDLRPDRNAHYAVRQCGKAGENELPIFVDLDVMRDMEAHAASDTRVELGGVMLGYQSQDDAGAPFVVITDSLRADHYHATRGSFKFTHDTWSDITQRRRQMHPDLQMVGWYHTHPGWGIFLSEMDLFICKNFFAKPSDVAFVIDPRQQTRGWFQWNSRGQTEQVGAFYLFSHRHRKDELDYFSRVYSGEPMSNYDPRYSEPPSNRGQTTIHFVDRNGNSQIIGWGILGVQSLLLILFAWKLMIAPGSSNMSNSTETAQLAQPTAQLELDAARGNIYRDIVRDLTRSDGTSPDLPKLYADAKLENEELDASNRSHVARIDQLEKELAHGTEQIASLTAENKALQQSATALEAKNSQLVQTASREPAEGNSLTTSLPWNIVGVPAWIWFAGAGILMVAALGLVVFAGSRRTRNARRRTDDFDDDVGDQISKLKSMA